MNVRQFTVSSNGGVFRQCDAYRISRSFRPFLEKRTAFARFAAENLRCVRRALITILRTFLIGGGRYDRTTQRGFFSFGRVACRD
ncbi:hypothetical protein EcCFBP13530_21640 [Enterobacter cancerogenus]|uniref:Uncharacterized protein n=1 Tax=Enterobacter cancerogenus TaxID=69218 RepID=A0AB38NZG9_9ENTR|nr:hypothetical protein EcCFBP13530_21640 [Enterobacter cancerogenus]